LGSELRDLLNYFVVENNKVVPVKRMEQYHTNTKNHDQQLAQTKIHHIMSELLTEKKMAKIFAKMNQYGKVRWIDLPKNKSIVAEIFSKYVVRRIKKQMTDLK